MTDMDTRTLAEKIEDARGDGCCKERADFMVWMATEARKLTSRDEILAGVARGDHVDAFERQERRQAARERLLDGLVNAGVLKGDGWRHIAALTHTWCVAKEPGVWVTLEEVGS
jgi:hypothetical protein